MQIDMSNVIKLDEIGLEKNKYIMREVKGIIYKITNTVNNKIYIGQTTLSFYRRYRDGFKKCHNVYLQRSIEKYGINKFKVEILAKNKSIEELDKLEIYLIKKYDSCNPKNGYNMKTGGGNGKHTEESLKRISNATKGKNKGKHNKNSKKTIIVYKGDTIIKDSRAEMIEYMKETYGLNILTWFDKGITYKYQKDIKSCGYLNDDGTVEECNRNDKKRGESHSKEIQVIYKGEKIVKKSMQEMHESLESKDLFGANGWYIYGMPVKYQNDITSFGYINENNTIDECKRNGGTKKKIQATLDGNIIIKESLNEFIEFIESEYNIKVARSWFGKQGVPYKYQSRFSSIEYIDKDGKIEECVRKQKRKVIVYN